MDAGLNFIKTEVAKQIPIARAEKAAAKVMYEGKALTLDKLEFVYAELDKADKGAEGNGTKKDLAISAMQALLESNGPTPATDLRDLVKSHLKDKHSISLVGIGRTLDAAQKDTRFVDTDGIISLARSSAPNNANNNASTVASKR